MHFLLEKVDFRCYVSLPEDILGLCYTVKNLYFSMGCWGSQGMVRTVEVVLLGVKIGSGLKQNIPYLANG